MQILGERFFKVSNATFCYGLKPVEVTVYCYLKCCAGSKGSCWPSMKKIAFNSGCSVNTARKAIDELEHRGFIRRVETFAEYCGHRRQTNNTYYILDLPPFPRPKDEAPVYVSADGEKVTA